MLDNFETEMTVMASRIAMKNYKLVPKQDKIERFEEYFGRYGLTPTWISKLKEGESVDPIPSARVNIRLYGLACKDWTPRDVFEYKTLLKPMRRSSKYKR